MQLDILSYDLQIFILILLQGGNRNCCQTSFYYGIKPNLWQCFALRTLSMAITYNIGITLVKVRNLASQGILVDFKNSRWSQGFLKSIKIPLARFLGCLEMILFTNKAITSWFLCYISIPQLISVYYSI